jgi:phosphopentomutase
MTPTSETVLDRLSAGASPTVAVGKIQDSLAGRGISRGVHTASDAEGMDAVDRELKITTEVSSSRISSISTRCTAIATTWKATPPTSSASTCV